MAAKHDAAPVASPWAEFTTHPVGYALQHLEDEVGVIRGAPVLVAAIFFLAILLTRWWDKRALSEVPTLKAQLEGERRQIAQQQEELRKLSEQLNRSPTSPTATSGTFAIEQLKWELRWKEKDKPNELCYFLREQQIPHGAILVLQIMVRITAIPARIVEDVQLSIAGNRLHLPAGYWSPRLVDKREQYFYFDIPSHIQLASHKAHLIAECQGSIEEKSPVFRVLLSRSYIT